MIITIDTEARTLSVHSPAAGLSRLELYLIAQACADCHLPSGDGYRLFASSVDQALAPADDLLS